MNADQRLALNRQRHPLSDRARAQMGMLAARDGRRCAYCGEERELDQLVLEHVIPKSMGGRHAIPREPGAGVPALRP